MKRADLRSLVSGWKAEYSFFTVAILMTVIYLYGQANRDLIALFSESITPLEAFAAFGIATLLLNAQRGEKGGGINRVYAAYSLGMLFWFIAECIWTLYTLVIRIEVPYPSIADVFWLVGYVPLLVALLLQAWPFREGFARWKQITLSLGILVMAGIILAVTIPPLFQQNQDSVTLAVSLAYPFLDTLLLSVAIPVFLLFRKGSYWRPMLFVMLGIMLQLIGDLLFAQTFLAGTYYAGSPADAIFDWSYLMLALGFYKGLKPNLS